MGLSGLPCRGSLWFPEDVGYICVAILGASQRMRGGVCSKCKRNSGKRWDKKEYRERSRRKTEIEEEGMRMEQNYILLGCKGEGLELAFSTGPVKGF